MEGITIIRVGFPDLEALQKIGKITFEETFGAQNTPEDMEKYLQEKFSDEPLRSELGNPESAFYFAKMDDTVVGYLKLNSGSAQTDLKEETALEIERIYVLKAYVGTGIGHQLMQHAIRIARDIQAKFIWLGVWEKNESALNFYSKNGFVAFDKHIFLLGDDSQIDLLMKLDLN